MDKNQRQENPKDMDIMDKQLTEKTNALYVEDKQKTSVVKKKENNAKFCPRDRGNKMATIQRDSSVCSRYRNQPRENANDVDIMDQLTEKTNALYVEDNFTSVVKKQENYAKFCPKDLGNKMATIERDSTVCSRDICFLVKFYLHSTSETRLSVTTVGHVELQQLTKKYNIERKAEGDNITLHRIAAAFPILTVNYLRQHKIERKFSTAMLNEKQAGDFPWCMRTQMCLSLAPKGKEYTNDPEYRIIIFAIIVFMYYENKIINSKRRIIPKMAIFQKVLNIAHTIYSEPLLEVQRQKHAWNHVKFDYTANIESVIQLLNSFRLENPDGEAICMARFEFLPAVNIHKNISYIVPKCQVADKKQRKGNKYGKPGTSKDNSKKLCG